MRVLLVHNPVAGANAQLSADELQSLIRAAGHEVRYQPSDTIDWANLERERWELIAVAGGDGTAGQIAKRLVNRGIPLTLLPMGTANNIAKSFALCERPLPELIKGWAGALPRWIDVGVIDSPWGSTRFIEAVGIGLFVRTMIEIDALDALSHLDSSKEKVAHALHLLGERLARFPVRQLNLLLDGKDLSGEYIMLEAMNIRFVGPNLYVAPASDPTDSLLDVVLIAERERADLQRFLASWKIGVTVAPQFTTHRGRHLQIEWQGSALHVDDEVWPSSQAPLRTTSGLIDIRLQPRALELRLPGP